MTRICCLCLDGLDYDFIVKHDYRELKQKLYGRVEIPDEFCKIYVSPSGERFKTPFTPLVWYGFLTGETPPHQFASKKGHWRWNNPFIEFARKVRRRIFPYGTLAGAMETVGFKRKIVGVKTYGDKSLIDLPDTVTANMILVDSRTGFMPQPLSKMRKMNHEQVVEALWDGFQVNRKQILTAIRKPWSLFLGYTKLADNFQDIMYGVTNQMHFVYYELGELITEMRKEAGDALFLVVSDHGAIPDPSNPRFGVHSEQGFYSLNKPLDELPDHPSITDFYPAIRSVL